MTRTSLALLVAILTLAAARGADAQSGGRWSVKTPMPTPRTEVAAAAVGAKIYVIGGFGRGGDLVEEYDTAGGRWRRLANLPRALHHIGAAGVGGKIYVIGGYSSGASMNTVYEYDPAANRWRAVPSMRVGRYKLRDTSLRLRDGRILVAGSGRYAELFDARTNSFTRVAGDLGDSYAFASSALLGDGRAVVLGGYDDAGRDTDGIWLFRDR